MTYTINKIREVFKNKGYLFFDESIFNLNIIGFRKSLLPEVDKFDDTLALIYRDETGTMVYREWDITTEPGKHYLNNPINTKGTAILVPGQYNGCYTIGLHNGKYEALVQSGPVKVFRDNNKDSVLDCDPLKMDDGYFGINIHRASKIKDEDLVGYYSAGCQVFRSSKDFQEFMVLVKKAKTLWGNRFTYTLLEQKDFLAHE